MFHASTEVYQKLEAAARTRDCGYVRVIFGYFKDLPSRMQSATPALQIATTPTCEAI